MSIQDEHKETWNAFVRRIHEIYKYTKNGISTCAIGDYFEGDLDDSINPFL